MLAPEIFTLLSGAVTGFIFKMMAQNAADRQAQFEMWMKSVKTLDESQDAAVKRVPNDKNGNWVRRIIVLSILFGVILAPFILTTMGKSIIVEVPVPIKSWLFGLWHTGGIPRFYELPSYLLIPEVRQALMAIIGFYFGNAAAKR